MKGSYSLVFHDYIKAQWWTVLSFQTQQTYEHVCYSVKKERWRENKNGRAPWSLLRGIANENKVAMLLSRAMLVLAWRPHILEQEKLIVKIWKICEWLQLHPHKKSYPLHKRFSVIGIGEFSAPQEERNKESWYLCTFTDEIQPKLHVLGFGNWYYKECLLVPRLFHLN